MVKLNIKDFPRFTDKIPSNIKVFLSYGNDEGLVFEASENVAKKINPDLNDAFNIEHITTDQIKSNPEAIYMAANSTSLMGGMKLIIIKEATDNFTQGIKEFLNSPSDAFIVLFGSAGLSKKSTLVQAIENASNAAALGCYADDTSSLRQLIIQTLQENQVKSSEEVVNFLISKLGADRKMTRSELDKLMTYLGEEKVLTLEAAIKCIDDASALSFENLTDAIFSKNRKEVSNSLEKLYQEGEAEIAILRIVSSYLKKFIPAYKLIYDGKSFNLDTSKITPRLNFKQEPKIRSNAKKWSYISLNKAMDILIEAEISCKTTNHPASIICERALLQIASLK